MQFGTLFNTRFPDFVGLLKDAVFQSTPKLSFGDVGQVQMFRRTGAATLKLRLQSSIVALGTARSLGQITFHRMETSSATEIPDIWTVALEFQFFDTVSRSSMHTYTCSQCFKQQFSSWTSVTRCHLDPDTQFHCEHVPFTSPAKRITHYSNFSGFLQKTTKNISFHKVVPGILVCVPCPRSSFAHATSICTFLTN